MNHYKLLKRTLLGGVRILRIFWLGLGLQVGGRRDTITGKVRVVRSPDVKCVKSCRIAIIGGPGNTFICSSES